MGEVAREPTSSTKGVVPRGLSNSPVTSASRPTQSLLEPVNIFAGHGIGFDMPLLLRSRAQLLSKDRGRSVEDAMTMH